MSSAIYITPKVPITVESWLAFWQTKIRYSPNTVGQNYFYGGESGEVEIRFGESGSVSNVNGVPDFSTAQPPAFAKTITVSSYFMSNLIDTANVARAIIGQWDCDFEYDQEFSVLMETANVRSAE